MIKKIILLLVLTLLQVEALENICTNKEEAGYGKEELAAYYIREEKIKKIEIECKKKDKNSCLILAMENLYNFHPCDSDNDRIREKGLKQLRFFCKKGSAKACFLLGYLEISYDEVNQDKYLSMACKLDDKYCSPINQKIDKTIFLDEIFNYHKDKLIRYKQVKKRIDFLHQSCVKEKNGMACYHLYLLYSHYTVIRGFLNSWVDEVNATKVNDYRYKSCIYSYAQIGCSAEYETDDQPPKKWLVDRAKKLKFVIPNPKFVPIQNENKEINEKRTFERSRVLVFRDDYFKKAWQINENSKWGYVYGTTWNTCKRLIPKNHSNWRFPLKKELLDMVSLFDKDIDFQYYWTSEQSKDDPMDYWVVDVKNGIIHEVYKNNHYEKGCIYVRDLNK